MSDAYNFITSDDPRTGALTATQLEARRRIAIALATRNRPYPKTIGEGLTALGEGLGEGFMNANLAKLEAAQQAREDEAGRRLGFGGGGAAAAPQTAPGRVSAADIPAEALQANAQAEPDGRVDVTQALVGPPPRPQAPPQMQPRPAPQPAQPVPPAPTVNAPGQTFAQNTNIPARTVQPGAQQAVPAGSSTPSTEDIPPRDLPEYPHPGPAQPPPKPPPMSALAREAFSQMNNSTFGAEARARAKNVFDFEEKIRADAHARDLDIWKTQEAERNKAMDEKRKYELGAPERRVQQQEARQKVEKDQREQQVAEAFKGMDPKQVEANAQKSREAADAQAAGYRSINEARAALTGGAIPVTGAFADQRLAAMKAATLAGVADYSKEIQATEVFRSSMAPVVASALKATVGSTQISNADREFAEKAAAGSITLDAGSIRRLLDITQRAQLIILNRHQDLIGGLYGKLNPRLGETLFGVDIGLPQDKVQLLMENQHKKADFDEKYGTGAADYVIRRQDWRRQAGF